MLRVILYLLTPGSVHLNHHLVILSLDNSKTDGKSWDSFLLLLRIVEENYKLKVREYPFPSSEDASALLVLGFLEKASPNIITSL